MLKLITAPNPILKQTCAEVKNLDEVIVLADEMLTFCKGRFYGLAAPQIGRAIQLFVVNLVYAGVPSFLLAMANPVVVKQEGQVKVWQGCLSIPGYEFLVLRPKLLKVRGFHLDGRVRSVKAHGFLAEIIAHEIDHLNGILVEDKAIDMRKV